MPSNYVYRRPPNRSGNDRRYTHFPVKPLVGIPWVVTWGADTMPSTLIAGQPYTFDVTVTNNSDVTWLSIGTVAVNFETHTRRGVSPGTSIIQFNGNHNPLPHDVVPGETVTFSVTVTIPNAPTDVHVVCVQFDLIELTVTHFGAFEGADLSLHTVNLTQAVTLDGAVGTLLGSLSRNSLKILSGSAGAVSGTLTRKTLKTLAGAAGAVSGTLTRKTLKTLAGVAGALTGAVSRHTSKMLTGTAGALSGAATTSLGAALRFVTLAGEVGAMAGTLTKRTSKSLVGQAGDLAGVLVTAVPNIVGHSVMAVVTKVPKTIEAIARLPRKTTASPRGRKKTTGKPPHIPPDSEN